MRNIYGCGKIYTDAGKYIRSGKIYTEWENISLDLARLFFWTEHPMVLRCIMYMWVTINRTNGTLRAHYRSIDLIFTYVELQFKFIYFQYDPG